ncbi:MAG TPA: RND transporter [Pirellulales bacterium]|nr:RND transporter [Pirellulales bacterium]
MYVPLRTSLALATLLAFCTGCGLPTPANLPAHAANSQAESSTSPTADGSEHKHDAWWCAEHGVPEEICGQCNSQLAANFQNKGDWCREHDRPDSQCFICHPELEKKFAARYEAKLGTRPPKPAG